MPADGVTVIVPVFTPQVVPVEEIVPGKYVTLLNVMVSELTNGDPLQELKVVLTSYCMLGSGGGQNVG